MLAPPAQSGPPASPRRAVEAARPQVLWGESMRPNLWVGAPRPGGCDTAPHPGRALSSVRVQHKITEIVVGPAAPPDTERTVRTMLRSIGIDWDIPVSRSDIPYRAS